MTRLPTAESLLQEGSYCQPIASGRPDLKLPLDLVLATPDL